MERNTCYLNLSVAEAARTVSELVERAGLSSRMVDCHELRQGENLCGMVLLFEKYFLRMGSRLTLTAVLDNLEGRTRLYWAFRRFPIFPKEALELRCPRRRIRRF